MSLPERMTPLPGSDQARARLLVLWVVWAVILLGLLVVYALLGRGPVRASPPGDVLVNLSGLVPLFLSIVVRWLVLPRYDSLDRVLPLFVVGLSLAEGCGLLGIFLGGAYRDDLFALGVLGIVQFVPFFARRLLEPKGRGFIPNN